MMMMRRRRRRRRLKTRYMQTGIKCRGSILRIYS
jgi:hypothetical protein